MALSGGTLGDRIRRQIVAVFVPEPTNPYDANAIAVQIDGQVIGYLPRATAQEYLPGLQRLMSEHGGYVALRGVIVGGGYYDDGPGRLGVWLKHNPADFGIRSTSLGSAPPGYVSADGVMRTGFTEAWLTDAEDDSYDLSWFNELLEADRPAIAKLRELLASDPDRLTGTSSSPSWRHGYTGRVTCTTRPWPSTTRRAAATTRKWTASARPSWPSGARSRCWTHTGRWPYASRS